MEPLRPVPLPGISEGVEVKVGRFSPGNFSPGSPGGRYSPLVPSSDLASERGSPLSPGGLELPPPRHRDNHRAVRSRLSLSTSVEDSIKAYIALRLAEAHSKAQRRRRRLSMNLLGSGFLSVVGGVVQALLAPQPADRIGMMVVLVGTYLSANAILPTDHLAVRALMAATTTLLAAATVAAVNAALGDSKLLTADPADCHHSSRTMGFCIVETSESVAFALVLFACLLRSLWCARVTFDAKGRCRPALYPRTALVQIWVIGRWLSASLGVAWFAGAIGYLAFGSNTAGARNKMKVEQTVSHLLVAATLMLCALLSTANARKGVRKFLAGSGAAAEEASAAASISAVMGNRHIESALFEATRAFRGIAFDQLSASDFDSNVSSTDLASKARHVQLGDVDYFFSHSWLDSPTAKWRALESFANHFTAERGGTPLLWLECAQARIDPCSSCRTCGNGAGLTAGSVRRLASQSRMPESGGHRRLALAPACAHGRMQGARRRRRQHVHAEIVVRRSDATSVTPTEPPCEWPRIDHALFERATSRQDVARAVCVGGDGQGPERHQCARRRHGQQPRPGLAPAAAPADSCEPTQSRIGIQAREGRLQGRQRRGGAMPVGGRSTEDTWDHRDVVYFSARLRQVHWQPNDRAARAREERGAQARQLLRFHPDTNGASRVGLRHPPLASRRWRIEAR
jgi:hypothetical protein